MKNSELTSLLDHLASKVYKSKVNNVKWLLPISIENPIERNDQLGKQFEDCSQPFRSRG